MKTETIVYCVLGLLLGMLLANMLKSVCGCKTVEGQILTSLSESLGTLPVNAPISPNYGFGGGGSNVDPDLYCYPIDGRPRKGSACDGKDTWRSCIYDIDCWPYSLNKLPSDKTERSHVLTNLRNSFIPPNMSLDDFRRKTTTSSDFNDFLSKLF